MLFEEIRKDFPKISPDDVHIRMMPEFPFEVVLQFSYLKDEVQNIDFSQFKKHRKIF